jgi:hypothetical protein
MKDRKMEAKSIREVVIFLAAIQIMRWCQYSTYEKVLYIRGAESTKSLWFEETYGQ